jgi:hypothetical protein
LNLKTTAEIRNELSRHVYRPSRATRAKTFVWKPNHTALCPSRKSAFLKFSGKPTFELRVSVEFVLPLGFEVHQRIP